MPPAAIAGVVFTATTLAGMLAGGVRGKMESGFVNLEEKLRELVTTINNERPSDGWGSPQNDQDMKDFIDQAKYLAANSKAVRSPPPQPGPEYLKTVDTFIQHGMSLMHGYATVDGILAEKQSGWAAAGDIAGMLIGNVVRTDLGHIRAIWPGIQTTLNALVGQLTKTKQAAEAAVQKQQQQQQAAPGAATDEQVLAQLADLSL
jgi:hypothetical protein